MQNIISTIQGGQKPLGFLLVAVFALCAATVDAAVRNWKGNGANTYWNTSGNWDTQPGSGDSLAFRTANVKNKTATLNGSYSYSGNIHIGNGSSVANPYIFVRRRGGELFSRLVSL